MEDESECEFAQVEKKERWTFIVKFLLFFLLFHIPSTQLLQKKKKVKSEHELVLLNFYCHKHFLKDHWIGKCVGVSFFFFKLPLSPLFSFSIDADLTSWNGCCFVFQMHLACVPARRLDFIYMCVFTAFVFVFFPLFIPAVKIGASALFKTAVPCFLFHPRSFLLFDYTLTLIYIFF